MIGITAKDSDPAVATATRDAMMAWVDQELQRIQDEVDVPQAQYISATRSSVSRTAEALPGSKLRALAALAAVVGLLTLVLTFGLDRLLLRRASRRQGRESARALGDDTGADVRPRFVDENEDSSTPRPTTWMPTGWFSGSTPSARGPETSAATRPQPVRVGRMNQPPQRRRSVASHAAQGGPSSLRLPACGFVVAYAVLLLCIPSQLIFRPLGAPGTPANMLGMCALAWWVAATVGGLNPVKRFTPTRIAVRCSPAAVLASYASGDAAGLVRTPGRAPGDGRVLDARAPQRRGDHGGHDQGRRPGPARPSRRGWESCS